MEELLKYVNECIKEGTPDADAYPSSGVSERTYKKLKYVINRNGHSNIIDGDESINGAYIRIKKEEKETKTTKPVKELTEATSQYKSLLLEMENIMMSRHSSSEFEFDKGDFGHITDEKIKNRNRIIDGLTKAQETLSKSVDQIIKEIGEEAREGWYEKHSEKQQALKQDIDDTVKRLREMYKDEERTYRKYETWKDLSLPILKELKNLRKLMWEDIDLSDVDQTKGMRWIISDAANDIMFFPNYDKGDMDIHLQNLNSHIRKMEEGIPTE